MRKERGTAHAVPFFLAKKICNNNKENE